MAYPKSIVVLFSQRVWHSNLAIILCSIPHYLNNSWYCSICQCTTNLIWLKFDYRNCRRGHWTGLQRWLVNMIEGYSLWGIPKINLLCESLVHLQIWGKYKILCNFLKTSGTGQLPLTKLIFRYKSLLVW